jgi:hypothetical protein
MSTSDDTATPALLRTEGPIATITLNRPAAFNSINLSIAQKLEQLGHEVEGNDDIRVLVIEGEGRAFSAGGDLQTIGAAAASDTVAPVVGELLTHYHAFIETLRPGAADISGRRQFYRAAGLPVGPGRPRRSGSRVEGGDPQIRRAAGTESAGRDRRHQVAGLSGGGYADPAATRCRGDQHHRRHAHGRFSRRGEEVHQQVEVKRRGANMVPVVPAFAGRQL